jgi:drug/metabolite transporter (DMT)-like permease
MTVASPATRTATPSAPSRGYLYSLLVLMVFFWALNFVVAKMALREFTPFLLTALRMGLAAVMLLGIFAATRTRRRTVRWTAREVLLLLVLGVSGMALNQGFFAAGLSRTSVVHAAIIMGLTPVQVLLLAAATGQETLTRRKVTGLAVAIAGVAVLQLPHDGHGAPSLAGDVCILLSGFTLAIYTVGGKDLTARHDSVTMNTFAYTGSAVVLSPVVVWQPFHFAAVSAGAWLCVAYMAVFASVVSYLIYGYALAHMAASRVSAVSYLQPLLATLMAIPILGEHLTAPILAGGALVLAGVYITERG